MKENYCELEEREKDRGRDEKERKGKRTRWK
jgi:hypothetical protein